MKTEDTMKTIKHLQEINAELVKAAKHGLAALFANGAPNCQASRELKAAISKAEGVKHTPKPLTCERCGLKTDAGIWLGFAYVGLECLTKDDNENL